MLYFNTKLKRFCVGCSVLFIDKYMYLHRGKEQSRKVISPPIHSAEVKCIRFWFKSEGKYFKRSLKLIIKSSDSNSSSPIWSVDEETPTWTFIQIPLQNIAKEFQVGTISITHCYSCSLLDRSGRQRPSFLLEERGQSFPLEQLLFFWVWYLKGIIHL